MEMFFQYFISTANKEPKEERAVDILFILASHLREQIGPTSLGSRQSPGHILLTLGKV